MPSIMGQWAQGAGPTLSALGSSIAGIPGSIAGAFSPSVAAGIPSDTPAPPSAPIDLSSTPSSGGAGTPSLLPSSGATSTAFGSGSAAPYPSLLTNPTPGAAPSLLSGATSGLPVMAGGGGTDPFGNINDPANAAGNITAPTPGGAQASLISRIISAITGKDPSKGGTGAFIGDIGNMGEAIQRFMVQRTLQNPSDVLKNSQILSRGLSKGLKRDVSAMTGQEMANAGLAGAPGLYAQSVANALAPLRYQQQQAALQAYLEAMRESQGMYPGSQYGPYGAYGGYGEYPGEQQQQAQASP